MGAFISFFAALPKIVSISPYCLSVTASILTLPVMGIAIFTRFLCTTRLSYEAQWRIYTENCIIT